MKRWHLVAYDVTDARRLRQVHRCMSRQALALQRSVFLFHGSRSELRALLEDVENLIDPERDDVRAYPSAHPGRMWMSSGIANVRKHSASGEAPLLLATPEEDTASTEPLSAWWRRLGTWL